MRRILIVEDDPAILKGLEASLGEEHYQVLSAMDGEEGYRLAREENVDLIILDIMLPRKNGDEICRDLRAEGIETPILMLTSKKEEMDKVLGPGRCEHDRASSPWKWIQTSRGWCVPSELLVSPDGVAFISIPARMTPGFVRRNTTCRPS